MRTDAEFEPNLAKSGILASTKAAAEAMKAATTRVQFAVATVVKDLGVVHGRCTKAKEAQGGDGRRQITVWAA